MADNQSSATTIVVALITAVTTCVCTYLTVTYNQKKTEAANNAAAQSIPAKPEPQPTRTETQPSSHPAPKPQPNPDIELPPQKKINLVQEFFDNSIPAHKPLVDLDPRWGQIIWKHSALYNPNLAYEAGFYITSMVDTHKVIGKLYYDELLPGAVVAGCNMYYTVELTSTSDPLTVNYKFWQRDIKRSDCHYTPPPTVSGTLTTADFTAISGNGQPILGPVEVMSVYKR